MKRFAYVFVPVVGAMVTLMLHFAPGGADPLRSALLIGLALSVFGAAALLSRKFRRKMRSVTTFSVYGRTRFLSAFAFYTAALCFAEKCFAQVAAEQFPWQMVLVFLAAGAAAYLIEAVLLHALFDKKWLKSATLILGAFVCMLSQIFWRFALAGQIVGYGLFVLGAGAMLSASNAFALDVQNVAKLAKNEKRQVATLVLTYEFLALSAALALFAAFWCLSEGMFGVIALASDVLLYFAGAFFLIAAFYVTAMPVNKRFAVKLQRYFARSNANVDYDLLEKHLLCNLTEKKRSIFMSLCVALLTPPFRCKVVGAENVQGDVPAVFLSNHYEIFGPLAFVASMPYVYRLWIWNKMLDKDILPTHMVEGVHNVTHFSYKTCNRIAALLTPPMLKVVHGLDPISVSRDNLRTMMTTLKQTVEAMQCGDCIAIFPENSRGKYKGQEVDDFFTGFTEIGSMYYKATGQRAVFHTTYVDKKHRRIVIGEGVTYDPDNNKHDERMRIAALLQKQMQSASENSAG